jgi:uncharacterized protein YjbI with pentapeptide repeats
MKIKISTQVLGVLMVALFFVTNVNAFSDKIHKNTIKKKGWHNSFFQLESDIAQLKNEMAALQAATNRSEYNSTSLAEKLVKLESDINALQDRIDSMSSQNSNADFGDMKLGKYQLVLPRGYFVQSMHEFDQFDFSGAYLKQSYFIEAVLTRTNFCGANLKMSSFYNATLNEVIFSGADLNKADFRGAKMTNVIWGDQECGYAICPDGTNAAENAGTCEGHLSN